MENAKKKKNMILRDVQRKIWTLFCFTLAVYPGNVSTS